MTIGNRILGIDPGYIVTGYAVVEPAHNAGRLITSGTIKSSGSLVERLKNIFEAISEIIQEQAPQAMSIENIFFHRDAQAVLKLGQARGAAVCAAAIKNLPVYEYSPTAVKKTIVGKGGADKAQVKFMVSRLLQVSERKSDDETDAMAIALCHAFSGSHNG